MERRNLRALRFIPTGVGNADRAVTRWTGHAVHPHGRGERKDDEGAVHNDYGSSPRAWGTPCPGSHALIKKRFIPTGVGNARLQGYKLAGYPVHPHGRGEGLPDGGADSGDVRFIPTGVGNAAPEPA